MKNVGEQASILHTVQLWLWRLIDTINLRCNQIIIKRKLQATHQY